MKTKTPIIIGLITLSVFGGSLFLQNYFLDGSAAFIQSPLSLIQPDTLRAQVNKPYSGTITDADETVCGGGGIALPGCKSHASAITYDTVLKKIAPEQSSGLLGIMGLISVITIMMAGMFYLTSMGDPAKAKKATTLLRNTIVGLVLGLMAYLMVQLVLNLNFMVSGASGQWAVASGQEIQTPLQRSLVVTRIFGSPLGDLLSHAHSIFFPVAHAAGLQDLIPSPPSGPDIKIPVSTKLDQGLGAFMEGGINILFYIAGPIMIIVFFLLGVKLVQSDGKDDAFKKAMQGIGYGALGLTLMGLAYAIARTLITFKL